MKPRMHDNFPPARSAWWRDSPRAAAWISTRGGLRPGSPRASNRGAVAINRSWSRTLPFDTRRDFAPVSVFSESPNVLVVNAKLPAASVKDLVGLARKSPGKLNYSAAGTRDSDTRKPMLEQGAEAVG